eukprot:545245-Pelagomonas_calceolata.AAC.2
MSEYSAPLVLLHSSTQAHVAAAATPVPAGLMHFCRAAHITQYSAPLVLLHPSVWVHALTAYLSSV